MALDPYSICPCGSGKKLKFCCADIAGPLEQVYKLMEAGQRQSALDQTEKLLATHPDKAALLSLKSSLQSQLGMHEQAAATIEQFVQRHPDNPIALADKAILEVQHTGARAGVEWLQQALTVGHEGIMPQVYEAIGIVAEALAAEGYWQAARAHGILQFQLQPEDEQARRFITRLLALPAMPTLCKEDLPLLPAPFDVPWKAEFDAALHEVDHLRWSVAEDKLTTLGERAANQSPPLWQNLAVLRSRLGDVPGTLEALRKLTASPGLPQHEAVEAEALAQLLDSTTADDTIDEVRVELQINDIDRLLELLAADRRASRIPSEALQHREGEVPPRAVFLLLDRALPASGVDLPYEAVPLVIGQMLIFGRETDRAARLVLDTDRNRLAQTQQLLAEMTADTLGAAGPETVIGKISMMQYALMIDWRLPPDTPPAHVMELMVRRRRDAVLNRWPKMAQKQFGGRTPEQAASDPAEKLKLMAAVLLVEMSIEHPSVPALVDELRGRLGLPIVGWIDPTGLDLTRVSLYRLGRLQVDKLADEDLLKQLARARFASARLIVQRLATEIVNRTSLHARIDLASVYGLLAELEETPERALELLGKARESAQAAKRSCARWDMSELLIRMQRGESAQATELFRHLQSKHGNEPGVSQTLMQLLYEIGAIGPDGRPAAGGAAMPGVTPAGAAQAASESKLWTPGSDAAAPAAQGASKPGIWMPGMD
jgi:tetratricopeptide (TPR) repeat protein